jgi:hypothetical protein
MLNPLVRVILAVGFFAAMNATASDPVVVLVERNPWATVAGADSPTLALYEDRTVIFCPLAPSQSPSGYLYSRLPQTEYDALLAGLEIQSLVKLDDSYEASDSFDEPTTELHVWVNGTRKSIAVYGSLRDQSKSPSAVPHLFVRAFDQLSSFATKSSPWVPDAIEILIWPFSYSTDVPISWPRDWPSYERSIPRGENGLRQIFLDASQLSALIQLRRGLRSSQAVLLAGQRWAISHRLPFPNEALWRR